MREEWDGARSEARLVLLELALDLADETIKAARGMVRAAPAADELIVALTELQWGSCDGCNTDDAQHKRNHCPACGAARFMCTEANPHPGEPGVHRAGCWVGAIVPTSSQIIHSVAVAAPAGSNERAKQLGIEKP